MSKKAKVSTKRGEVSTTGAPSEASLLAEAHTLGPQFQRATVAMIDVLEDARELLLARGDVPDLIARGYRVDDTMFERVKLIREMLAPDASEPAAPTEEASEMAEAAREMRTRLVSIHDRLGRIGRAAGVDEEVFVINTRKSSTLVSSMAAMISKLRAVQAELPDQKQVEALIAEATSLIATEEASRSTAQVRVQKGREKVLKVQQLKRLLVDQMRHLSTQGLAAYPDDLVRELSYELKRLTKRSVKATNEGPPAPANPEEVPA